MLSIALFFWYSLSPVALQPGNYDLPVFSRFNYCQFYEATDRNDIYYPDQCPRLPQAVGQICFPNGGNYSVNLQMSFVPGSPAEGNILLQSLNPPPQFYPPDYYSNSQFLLAWKSGPSYTLQGNTIVLKAAPGECFVPKYSSTGYAQINNDPRATRLTIYKLP
jgi:hypothetical protein